MGDGKWLLLKTIDKQGSLKAAAETLGISYRKAWGDINKTKNLLGFPLVEKHRGGKSGGNTFLTQDGKKLIKAYEQFHSDFSNSVQMAFKEFLKRLKK
ncbi:MAG: LysR family transcriptional regulator [Bacteroidota bacterium]